MSQITLIKEGEPESSSRLTTDKIKNISRSSITFLDAQDMLDRSPNRMELLQLLVSKIRKGGKIRVFGKDIDMATKQYLFQNISLQEYNKQIYDGRQSISTLMDTTSILEKLGFSILTKNQSTVSLEYHIEAIRN